MLEEVGGVVLVPKTPRLVDAIMTPAAIMTASNAEAMILFLELMERK